MTFGTALAELAGPAIERMVQLEETFAQYHLEEPLYYCQFLATVPRTSATQRSAPPRTRRISNSTFAG